MGRKDPSLQYALTQRVLPEIQNNLTGTAYKKRIKEFADWAKEHGYKRTGDITKEVVQEYEKHLENNPKRYAPATIHTYLSPVCSAAGVRMEEIRKPRRAAGKITRGRDHDAAGTKVVKNVQGKRQEEDPRYARLMTLQKAVGIRRAELGKLKGADFVRRGNSWYVRVRNGKGGKEQFQLVLPEDVPAVKAVFKGVAADQKVFSREEMANKINLHGIRATHAKDCYHHYADMIEKHPEVAEKLRSTLLSRWDEGHERLKNSNPKAWKAQREKFVRDMDDRPYLLRGDNLRKAEALGIPTAYNRLALMCVSVFHLSHWRLDVTTTNYLVT